MKKLLRTGKKTLSVIMAVMMVLTAWVWVAPTEASAANGSYYVKITWKCVNKRTYDNNYTGYNNRGNGQCGLSLFYKSNNGRGTESEVYWNIGKGTSGSSGVSNTGWMNATGTYSATATISGFPTKLFIFSDNNYILDESEMQVEKIEVGSSSSATLTTLWSGTAYIASSTEQYYITIADGVGTGNNSDYAKVSTTTSNWVYPYVKSATSISSATAVAAIGIPPLGDKKDTSISTRSIQYYALDNYSVRYEPTSYTVTGVSGLTTGSGWSCGSAYPITATSSTTKSTVDVSQTATVTMNWNNGKSTTGQKADTTATFQVYNPRYKVAYDGNGGTLGTGYTYAYYGRAINHSTSTATTNNVAGLDAELFPTTGIKEGYTFDGMYTAANGGSKISASQTVSADVTYYAHWNINQYTATFYGTKANDAGTDTVEYIIDTSTVNYNNNPVPPSTVDGYSLGDYDYTFAGWDKAISPIGINGAEYRATYTSTFVPADYGAVDGIVAEANDIINGENYKGIYSEESRHALENAVNSVVYNQGRTNQEIVDGYVPLIRAAIDGLGRQKYSVLFIDAVDNSVIELRYPVYYGDAITMPEAPVRGFTSTDHYVFREWTTSEDGDNINFVEKNMIIIANYDKIAHTYTDTELPSNCTTQAGVLHKCSCGYEYVEYAGSVGTEHNLEADFTVDIAPTCTTVGSKSRHCTRCSYRADVTEIPALDHDFTDGYKGVVIAPGCENDGAEVSECQRCGYDKYSLIPAVGHAQTENDIAPTCTSNGYTVKTCSNCYDEDIVSFVDPIAHTYTEATDEYVAPTCTGLGKKVSYCSCGAQKVETIASNGHAWNVELTTDYDATCTTKGQQSIHCSVCDVINGESITEIPEKGHTWGEEVCEQKESCGIRGLYVKTCEVCQVNSSRWVDALTHNYKTTTTPATCTEAGSSVETCENCGDIKNPAVIQPTGHKYEKEGAIEAVEATCTAPAYKKYKCDVCGDTRVEYIEGSTALLHDFTGTETIINDATCETDGEKTVKCSRCDVTTEVIIPKLGHSYGAWQVVTEATNTQDGQWKRVCANNAEHVEYITIPKGGHTWDSGTVTKSATCTETGTMVYKCNAHTDCGITLEVTIPVTQHTVAQKVTAATCTTPGTVKAYCSVCDANCENPFSTTETPVVPHTFNNGTATDATCTTSGYTTYTCTADDCDFSYKVYDETKPATGHVSWTETGREDASCTEDGSVSYKCDKCNETKTEILPKTGHSFVEDAAAATSATCTALATKTYKCSCGASYVEHYGTLAEHKFDTLVKTVPATNDSLGYEERKCACGLTEITIIEATGTHVFGEKIAEECVAPTCTENGTDVYKCTAHTDCGAKSSVLVPRLGHTVTAVYNAPTCVAEGSSDAYCTTCKTTIATETIPAIAYHNFSGTGVKVDATCTATGTMTYTCLTDGCNATKVETIPAKGHSLTTTVTDATCGVAGSVVTSCANCSYSKTTVLAAKNHNWNNGEIKEGDAATCEGTGVKTYTCTLCGATKTEEIPATGHTWGAWTVTPSTNSTPGSVSRECAICHEKESVEIPAGGHNLVVDTEASTDATCKTEGKLVYKCDKHTDCGISVEVTTAKTQHTVVQKEIEATCKVPGKVEAYCSVCSVVLSSEVIPVKAHEYVAQEAVAPTCASSGYTPYKCSCGDTYNKYDETKPATAHELVEGTSTATCTNGGEMTVTCKNCTYSSTVKVAALGHNYVENESAATDATCAVPATKTYECSRCTASYTVYDGEKSTEHTWGGWVIKENANAISLGYQTAECSVCGQIKVETIPATGEHNYSIETSRTDATCTADGSVTYKCSTHNDCGLTSTVTLPKLGHTEALEYTPATCEGKGSTKLVCSVESCKAVLDSKEIPALGHLYGDATVTNATCKDKGKLEYTCTRTGCTDTKTVEIPTNANAHQYATVVTDSTCTVKGSVVTKCALCDNVTTNKELPLIEHSWNGGEVKQGDAATCEADGTKTYTCTTCGATKTETIAKLGHDWNDWVKVDATNDTDGSWTRTCKNDANHVETVVIPKGGHTWDEGTVTKEASCTETGTKVYKCKTHTGDAACGVTFTVTLDKLQHKLETNTVTAVTCDNDGEVVTSCTECKAKLVTTIIPATGHDYRGTVTTPATCTAEGTITYTCAHDATHNYTEPIAKIQHNHVAGTSVAPTCTSSGYTVYTCACGHSYSEIGAAPIGHTIVKSASNATCTTGDTIVISCENCSFKQEVVVPALGHNYEKKTELSTSATCAAPATETYECSRCDASYTDFVGEKTNAHTYDDNWTVIKDATEVSIGYKTRACKVCGQLDVATIDAKGEHKFADGDLVESKAATCTENGYEIRKCSAHASCGEQGTIVLLATGHDEIKTTTAYADCVNAGSITTTCSKCDLNEVEAIPALGHAYGEGEVTAATCKKEGSIVHTCTRQNCGATYTTVIAVDENAHDLKVDVNQATCTTDGSITVSCKNGCDYKEETAIPAKGHTYTGTVTVVEDATCTADGEKTVKCASCDAVDTVVIAKLGHNMQEGTAVAATCTTSGYTPYSCLNEGCTHSYNVYDEAKPAKGHTWGEWTIVDNATQDADGLKSRSCTVCSNGVEEQIIPAMKHEMTVTETVAATCKAAGHITYECNIKHEGVTCGYTLVVELPVVPHTLSTAVTPATCTAEGSVVTTCAVDGCDYSETVVLDTIPHKEILSITPADCENPGYAVTTCDICKDEIQRKEIAALGHNYDDSIAKNVTVTKEASCTEAGSKTVKCSRCDMTKTVEIPKLGHEYETAETVAATCKEGAYTLEKCKCGASYKNYTSEALEHNWNSGTVTAAATCSVNGEKTYTCTACGTTKTELIAKLDHDWSEWTVKLAPSATIAGILERVCKKCGKTEYTTIPALGGLATYTVTFVYGNNTAKQSVSYGSSAEAPDASKAPDASYHYSYIWDKQFNNIVDDITVNAIYTAKEHTFGEWVTVTPATCSSVGEKRRECECGYIEYEAVEKTGHSMVVTDAGKPATCTENGYEKVKCEVCGQTEDRVLQRLGHVFTYHEAIDPTCDTDGLTGHYSCSRCGKNYKDRAGKNEIADVVISKRYHTFLVVEGSDATCTAEGRTDYMYCTVCGYTRNPETIPATGHVDANGDNTCDNCGATYMENNTIVCSCSCHKNGFFNELIYKILSFFWRLFGTNKSCECGRVHY